MRYINLLDRVSHVKTSKCFIYNNAIIFAVPSQFMRKAIGINGNNVRAIQDVLGRRIKVVRESDGFDDVARFIQDIVEPFSFKSLDFANDYVVITAGGHNKAALIGRNKARLEELSVIVESNFGKRLRII